MSSQPFEEYTADSWLTDQITGVESDVDEIIEYLAPDCADGPDDLRELEDMARQINAIRKKLYIASRAIESRLHNDPDDLRFCPVCSSSVIWLESSRGKETFQSSMCCRCSDKHAETAAPEMKRRRTE
jgi:hypothetical protein